MARKLSPLTAELVLDIKKWTSGINQAQKDAKAVTSSLKPLTDTMKQTGTVFAAAGAVIGGALLGLAKKAADYGDEMLEASQKTGITTKNLASLRLVAEQSGSSFEGVTGAVTKLSKTMFEAATKGGDAAKVFTALGISVKDSTGHVREASDVMPQIAERFAQMKDGSEKTAIAIKLFGKAGADMIPMLNEGAEGFRRAAALTEKYNLALTDAEANLGNKFNDTLAETSLGFQGLASQVGNALLPAMTKMVAIFNNALAMISKLAKEHPEWTRAIALTAAALTGAGGLLLGLTAILLVLPKIQQSLTLMKAMLLATNPVILGITAAVVLLTAAFIKFPQIRGPVLDTLQQIYQGAALVVGGLTNLAFVASKVLSGNIMGAFSAIKNLPTNVMDDVMDAGDRFSRFASGVGDLGKAMSLGDIAGDAKKLANELNGLNLDGFGKDAKEAASQVETMWKALKRESGEAADLEAVLMRASAAHIDEHVILEKLGPTINQVAAESRLYGEKLGPLTARFAKLIPMLQLANKSWDLQADLIKAVNEAASLNEFDPNILLPVDMTMPTGGPLSGKNIGSQMAQDWRDIFARITDDLIDMIVDFDFSFKRLGDIAKNTAKSLLTSFLDGFFKPFRDQLAGLGESLGKALSKAVMGSGGISGVLSKIPGLGGIFGGATAAGGTAAGTAGAAGAGGGSLAGIAAVAGPAAIAAGAAFAVMKLFPSSPFGNTKGALFASVTQSELMNQLHNQGIDFDKLALENPGLSASGIISLAQNQVGAAGGNTNNLTINVNGVGMSVLEIRDTVVPAITDMLQSNARGVSESWYQSIIGPNDSTPVPVGI